MRYKLESNSASPHNDTDIEMQSAHIEKNRSSKNSSRMVSLNFGYLVRDFRSSGFRNSGPTSDAAATDAGQTLPPMMNVRNSRAVRSRSSLSTIPSFLAFLFRQRSLEPEEETLRHESGPSVPRRFPRGLTNSIDYRLSPEFLMTRKSAVASMTSQGAMEVFPGHSHGSLSRTKNELAKATSHILFYKSCIALLIAALVAVVIVIVFKSKP